MKIAYVQFAIVVGVVLLALEIVRINDENISLKESRQVICTIKFNNSVADMPCTVKENLAEVKL